MLPQGSTRLKVGAIICFVCVSVWFNRPFLVQWTVFLVIRIPFAAGFGLWPHGMASMKGPQFLIRGRVGKEGICVVVTAVSEQQHLYKVHSNTPQLPDMPTLNQLFSLYWVHSCVSDRNKNGFPLAKSTAVIPRNITSNWQVLPHFKLIAHMGTAVIIHTVVLPNTRQHEFWYEIHLFQPHLYIQSLCKAIFEARYSLLRTHFAFVQFRKWKKGIRLEKVSVWKTIKF